MVGLLLRLQLQRGQKPDTQADRKRMLDLALECEYQRVAVAFCTVPHASE